MTIYEKQFNCIKKYFNVTLAAGGIVRVGDEILIIKRRGVWDLPKGKKNKNESLEECAIREISEECGILNPVIEKKLTISVYVYKIPTIGNIKTKPFLKIVHWYILILEKKQRTKTQPDEGIEKVQWVKLALANKRLETSYPTIKEVFKTFTKNNRLQFAD